MIVICNVSHFTVLTMSLLKNSLLIPICPFSGEKNVGYPSLLMDRSTHLSTQRCSFMEQHRRLGYLLKRCFARAGIAESNNIALSHTTSAQAHTFLRNQLNLINLISVSSAALKKHFRFAKC